MIATKVGSDFYHGPFRKNFDQTISVSRSKKPGALTYGLHRHLPASQPPLMMLERGTHYAVLDELKQEGKNCYYGVSVHDAYEGTMAIATGKPDVIQVAYNFLRQDPVRISFRSPRSMILA